MKNVAILFSISYKAPNGASSFVRAFKSKEDFFKSHHINFHVYSRDNYEDCDFSPNNSTRIRKHKIKKVLFKIINHSPLLTILYDYFAESRTARKIVEHYLEQGFNDDIVHCQEDQTAYYLLKKQKNIKVITSLHNDGKDFSIYFDSRPALNSWLGKKYLSHRFNYIINNSYKIGFVSRGPMEIFATRHPEVCNKLFYVYNGIPQKPLSHIYPEQGYVRFICVASINDNKNQKSIIEAISLLSIEVRKKVKLLIVGGGPQRNNLENLVEELNLKDYVQFYGVSDNVDSLLAQSDVFILTSKSEGLPVSIIEAMREGLPIIGSNVGGIPEQVIDGENGYIVDTTAQGIASGITKIIQDGYEIRKKMGEKSYKHFLQNFSDKVMFKGYADIYNSIYG